MKPAELTRLFTVNHYALHKNLDGVTPEEALEQPVAGNCLNWIVGHIVANRNHVLTLLGRDPYWPPEAVERYKRGSAPVTGPDGALPLDRLVSDFDRSQELILAGLAAATEADLDQKRGDDTVGGSISFLHFHEAYHIGQTAILRRLVGKEGAIR